MSVLSGALGHVLWDDGEAAEPAKLFPIRVTAVDEITATFDCGCLAYRGSSSKGLPFDRFILEDPDGYVGVGSTSQVQPAVSSFEAVPTGLPIHWVDENGHELKVGAVLATCEDSDGSIHSRGQKGNDQIKKKTSQVNTETRKPRQDLMHPWG